jgi:hypothetical protein
MAKSCWPFAGHDAAAPFVQMICFHFAYNQEKGLMKRLCRRRLSDYEANAREQCSLQKPVGKSFQINKCV